MPTAADVLAGTARWGVECADVLAFLRGLPDDSIDLLLTSPPYLEARTYGIGAGRKLDDWVAWMTAVVTAAAPKVTGLIAVNCEGQTRDYRYLPAPYLLLADLHRAGLNLRRPVAFHRVGIPGSGGPDWLRADWEPVVCVTRPGRLPWSDNTACGHPPKWAPGGAMSHRVTDGTRVNQWGRPGGGRESGGQNGTDGAVERKPRPSHAVMAKGDRTDKRVTDGTRGGADKQGYAPPALANPGNMVQERYTADEVAALLAAAGDVTHHNVGGGQMGHPLAHENEAPFPLTLAEFFVRSFCPPGGRVLDCFCGSGTVLHAAVLHGRVGIGCDVRPGQCEVVGRRLATVVPDLFAAG